MYSILGINNENFIHILPGNHNYYGYIIPELRHRRSLLQIDTQLQRYYVHPDVERMARISYKGAHKSVLLLPIRVKGCHPKGEYAFT